MRTPSLTPSGLSQFAALSRRRSMTSIQKSLIGARPAETSPTVHHVVVLGAGYAGLPAAKRLARQVHADEVRVTLVSRDDHFVERPRIPQVCAGHGLRRLELRASLAGTGVHLAVGTVTGLDLGERTVVMETGAGREHLDYDTLIYALGSGIDSTAVPGVAEHAHVLNSVEAARDLARSLRSTDPARVVVCGGGLTGIELAAEIAESQSHLTVELVSSSDPGGWLSAPARRYLRRVLDDLGVIVRTGTRITAVEAGRLVMADDGVVPFEHCAWAGGFTVPSLAAESGLDVDADGRVVVDGRLQARSHPDVYVIGDAAAVPGAWGPHLAMGCRSGGFTGPKVADVVAARLTGRDEVPPLRFRYVHECISLGRRRGLVQFLHADERPTERILTGRLAMVYKNLTLNAGKLLFRWPGPFGRSRRHLAHPGGR